MSDSGGLVPLPWEERNLGVAAFGLGEDWLDRMDGEALHACLAAKAAECGRFFVQARVRIDTRSTRVLEQNGFYLVEATVCPHTVLDRNSALRDFLSDPGSFLPDRYALDDLQTDRLDKAEAGLCAAVRQIAGESFTNDRFHADHNCARSVADKRFIYWIDDLLGDPAVAFDIMFLEGRPVAFMARKADNLILAGFAKKYSGAGLGDYFWLHALRQVKAEGLNRAHTLISVCNIPVLNLYARLGFKFREPCATFHYWKQLENSP